MSEKMSGIFPVQCSCGHLYLEKYQFDRPTEEGNIGFVWCGFCRTKVMVADTQPEEVSNAN